MLLGIRITSTLVIYGGLVVFALFLFQVLQGSRVIRFKGRLHMKIHRASAYATLAVAAVHGLMALVYLGVFR
ncbi:MAG: hypothetical protein Kow0067_15630 [Coriobacteriia bacterium]